MAPPTPPPVRPSGELAGKVAQSSSRRNAGNPPVNRPQTSPLTSSEQFADRESDVNGPREGGIRAKLVIQRGGKVGKEFPVVEPEALIGRWDADGGIFPDIDLDQDDPEAKVSRRHARIQLQSNQFVIEDLGSTNGTFINRGPRLLPGNKQPLKHGDEIIVGKTFLRFVLS
jgi:pSer/pThr/pTyr-binding forkhead associated (FHA) protein